MTSEKNLVNFLFRFYLFNKFAYLILQTDKLLVKTLKLKRTASKKYYQRELSLRYFPNRTLSSTFSCQSPYLRPRQFRVCSKWSFFVVALDSRESSSRLRNKCMHLLSKVCGVCTRIQYGLKITKLELQFFWKKNLPESAERLSDVNQSLVRCRIDTFSFLLFFSFWLDNSQLRSAVGFEKLVVNRHNLLL